MKSFLSLICLLLVSTTLLAQKPTGNAQAKGACNAPTTGNNNHIVIKCSGIGTKQGQQIIALLNKALAQPDSTAVLSQLNSKLDEILNAVNPNRAVVTYDCLGIRRTSSPGASDLLNLSVGDRKENEDNREAFQRLAQTADWSGLLSRAQDVMAAEPAWLTPQLMASLAYYKLGQLSEARDLFSKYQSRTGDAYNEEFCNIVVNLLEAGLK